MRSLGPTLLCAALASASFVGKALAHKPSDSYLRIAEDGSGVRAEWDAALYDLELALGLDADRSGTLTFGEVEAAKARIVEAAKEHIVFRSASRDCSLATTADELALSLLHHSDGPYARVALAYECDGEPRELAYAFLSDVDAQHRAIVQRGEHTEVIRREHPRLALQRGETSAFALVREGIEHIFAGLDHLLFLLALVLPLWFGSKARQGSCLRDVVSVVTAFTLAHSLTLALAAFGVVRLAASVVEPAIAATLAIAAVANLREREPTGRASLAFTLGLLHGFGFASALSDLGLAGAALGRALLAFNVGVELGQVAVVLAFLTLGAALGRAGSSRLVLRGGSLGVLAMSLFWLIERLQKG